MNDTYEQRGSGAASVWAIPGAILIGFGLIALSIYLGGDKEIAKKSDQAPANSPSLENIKPVTAEDHIRGNPNAPVMIVEYSDFDCPYCKTFHLTMQKLIEEYGPSGKVAWTYRHLPLPSLHPSAPYIAGASECVAELGGNEAFWKFADMVFGERGPNELTNVSQLPDYAEDAGVERAAYEECVKENRHMDKVDADASDAVAIGARGTPYSVILMGDQKMVINGAENYDRMKILIDGLVK
jgi:protein-disulfide isomerase